MRCHLCHAHASFLFMPFAPTSASALPTCSHCMPTFYEPQSYDLQTPTTSASAVGALHSFAKSAPAGIPRGGSRALRGRALRTSALVFRASGKSARGRRPALTESAADQATLDAILGIIQTAESKPQSTATAPTTAARKKTGRKRVPINEPPPKGKEPTPVPNLPFFPMPPSSPPPPPTAEEQRVSAASSPYRPSPLPDSPIPDSPISQAKVDAFLWRLSQSDPNNPDYGIAGSPSGIADSPRGVPLIPLWPSATDTATAESIAAIDEGNEALAAENLRLESEGAAARSLELVNYTAGSRRPKPAGTSSTKKKQEKTPRAPKIKYTPGQEDAYVTALFESTGATDAEKRATLSALLRRKKLAKEHKDALRRARDLYDERKTQEKQRKVQEEHLKAQEEHRKELAASDKQESTYAEILRLQEAGEPVTQAAKDWAERYGRWKTEVEALERAHAEEARRAAELEKSRREAEVRRVAERAQKVRAVFAAQAAEDEQARLNAEAARDTAAREQAVRDDVARAKAAQDEAARAQIAREQATRVEGMSQPPGRIPIQDAPKSSQPERPLMSRLKKLKTLKKSETAGKLPTPPKQSTSKSSTPKLRATVTPPPTSETPSVQVTPEVPQPSSPVASEYSSSSGSESSSEEEGKAPPLAAPTPAPAPPAPLRPEDLDASRSLLNISNNNNRFPMSGEKEKRKRLARAAAIFIVGASASDANMFTPDRKLAVSVWKKLTPEDRQTQTNSKEVDHLVAVYNASLKKP